MSFCDALDGNVKLDGPISSQINIMEKLLEWTFYGNPLLDWITALGLFVFCIVTFGIFKIIISRRLKKSFHHFAAGKWIANALEKTSWFLLFVISLYIGSRHLDFKPRADAIIKGFFITAACLQLALWLQAVIKSWFDSFLERKSRENASAVPALSLLGFAVRIGLWIVVLLVALDNLGVNVTTLVASLGVGGIAVALAAQKILEDLFASLSIVLDKPFVQGDFIVVGELKGTVEHIGLKTTRLRSLSGELLIFSNADLLQSRIQNYQKMFERRVLFKIGIIYETPIELVKKVPQIIRQAIDLQDKTRFDRCHFFNYGDFSLDYETVYFVKDRDYNIYMDIHQAINLFILEAFQKEGIEFAYPTQVEYSRITRETIVSDEP